MQTIYWKKRRGHSNFINKQETEIPFKDFYLRFDVQQARHITDTQSLHVDTLLRWVYMTLFDPVSEEKIEKYTMLRQFSDGSFIGLQKVSFESARTTQNSDGN